MKPTVLDASVDLGFTFGSASAMVDEDRLADRSILSFARQDARTIHSLSI